MNQIENSATLFGYKLIENSEGSVLSLHETNGIIKVSWHGVVDRAVAEKLLSGAAEFAHGGQFTSLILDRSELVEFTAAARVWIKKVFFDGNTRRLSKFVKHIATINSSTRKAMIYEKYIHVLVKFLFPKNEIRSFKTLCEAEKWLCDNGN